MPLAGAGAGAFVKSQPGNLTRVNPMDPLLGAEDQLLRAPRRCSCFDLLLKECCKCCLGTIRKPLVCVAGWLLLTFFVYIFIRYWLLA